MILAVHCGNTQTRVSCVDGTTVCTPVFALETNLNRTTFEYADSISRMLTLTGYSPADVEGCILACVVPPLTETLSGALKLLCHKNVLVVSAGIRTGIRLKIDDPGSAAADIVASAVAAREYYPLPAVILSLDTATTATIVDSSGTYIGGVILPGVGISSRALAGSTSLLPTIDLKPAKKVIATSTADAMKAGLIYGNAGALDGILDRFEAELGEPPASIIATGHYAAPIVSCCRHKLIINETLLMQGLGLIWQRNIK